MQRRLDELAAGLGFGLFVGPIELRVAVQPKDHAVEVFLRKVHAVVPLVKVLQQLGRPHAAADVPRVDAYGSKAKRMRPMLTP